MGGSPDRTAWLKGGTASCLNPPPAPPGLPWRLLLMGAPGVGKGTQADLLCERLAACHLSTGDVFRAAKASVVKERSLALRQALDFMKRGALVPDSTVLALVAERGRCLRCAGGFVLDGFPRTVGQAEALERLLIDQGVGLDAVFDYQLPLEEIVARLSGRRVCPDCKATYHVTGCPPRVAGICDRCGGKLQQREDDRPEAVQVRMRAYDETAGPLLEFYRARHLLVTVPARGSPEEIYERTWQLASTLRPGLTPARRKRPSTGGGNP